MTRISSFLLIILSLLVFHFQVAEAASVSVTSSGNGTFVINGQGMDTVAGIELAVSYDSSSLNNPSVSQGGLVSGALMAANTNNPGSIRIAIISTRPFSGSGPIATISFANHSGTGNINVSSSMIDSKGAPVAGGGTASAVDSSSATAGSGLLQTAGIPFSQPTSTTATTPAAGTTTIASTASTASPSTASVPTYLGTVSMPTDVPTKSENTKPADSTAPDPNLNGARIAAPETGKPSEPPAMDKTVAEMPKPVKAKETSYVGTLENFRTYTGEKSPAKFVALFNKEVAKTIHQEPAIAVSDGKTSVKIVVKLESIADKSPNFALSGAKLVSLNRDNSSGWIIEALPQTGTLSANLTILSDSDIIDYPLTLVPPLSGITGSETDFSNFLKDSGVAAPKRDLNDDGKHDYLDDFIYTGHYLIQKNIIEKPKK